MISVIRDKNFHDRDWVLAPERARVGVGRSRSPCIGVLKVQVAVRQGVRLVVFYKLEEVVELWHMIQMKI